MNHVIVPSCKCDVLYVLRHVNRAGSVYALSTLENLRFLSYPQISSHECSIRPHGQKYSWNKWRKSLKPLNCSKGIVGDPLISSQFLCPTRFLRRQPHLCIFQFFCADINASGQLLIGGDICKVLPGFPKSQLTRLKFDKKNTHWYSLFWTQIFGSPTQRLRLFCQDKDKDKLLC